jgi:spore maturation protein CgeB
MKEHPSVILVGETFPASRTTQRANAMQAMGCRVDSVATTPPDTDYETRPDLIARLRYRLRIPGDPAAANARLLDRVTSDTDVIWLEAARMIEAKTLWRAKEINPDIQILCYSEDDLMNPRNRSRQQEQILPIVDLWVTTKSFNVDRLELPSLGVRKILFVNNSYDPGVHRPVELKPEDRAVYGSPISFVGSFEKPRSNSLLALAEAGLKVRVWGNGWESMTKSHENLRIEGRPAYNDEFAKVVAGTPINLCFLRHANRDLQTCRSIELPSCGGFMVHERNEEISQLFPENVSAVYFTGDRELCRVCHEWLSRDRDRKAVAAAGMKRVGEMQMTHADNIQRIFDRLTGIAAGSAK